MKKLHIDIETFSDQDLSDVGVYKYSESLKFHIRLLAYALDDGDVTVLDFSKKRSFTTEFLTYFYDSSILKCAHNANFERVCLAKYDLEVPVEEWHCTSIKAAYCGLPRSLAKLSALLGLGEKGKMEEGKRLIELFCTPQMTDGLHYARVSDYEDDWRLFKEYVKRDVIAEREIDRYLSNIEMPKTEWEAYYLDQKINDRGVLLDMKLVRSLIIARDNLFKEKVRESKTYGLNINSSMQLRHWLSARGVETKKTDSETIAAILSTTQSETIKTVLGIKQTLGKSSLKKFDTMGKVASIYDGRARGLFAFYGAERTGRWSGRLIQLQNLPRNVLTGTDLAIARDLALEGIYHHKEVKEEDILSDLIRTCIVPSRNKKLAVSDFSAIEARVLSWLAGEEWRLEVFRTHGKIYEASAARMFNVPFESVTKGSELRMKGKIAELALGYQGSSSALAAMDGGTLDDETREDVVTQWRAANPRIVNLWRELDEATRNVIRYGHPIAVAGGKSVVGKNGDFLYITLPSGRSLHYYKTFLLPSITTGEEEISFKSEHTRETTYGGKLVENITQAIARDLLTYTMCFLDWLEFDIVMHVHDEIVCEVDESDANFWLDSMCKVMSMQIPWAQGLPLKADGYVCDYYKKD